MRFHMGVSFRLKSLKKFIIPLLVGVLAYLFSSGILTVKAEEQETIVINTTNVEDLNICGRPVTDYINYFEQYTSNKYRFILSSSTDFDKFTFWFIPNYFDDINYSIVSYNGSTSNFGKWISFTNVSQNNRTYLNDYEFYLQIASNSLCDNISFLDNVNAQAEFLDLMENYYDFRNNPYTQDFPSINSTELGLISWPSGKRWLQCGDNRLCSDVGDQPDGYMWNILYSNTPIYYDTTIENWYQYWNENYSILPVIYNGNLLQNNDAIEFNYYPPQYFDEFTKINDIYIYTKVNNLYLVDLEIEYQTVVSDFDESTLSFTMGGLKEETIQDNPYAIRSFDFLDTSNCTYTGNITNTKIEIYNISCPSNVTNGYDYISLKFHLNTNDYTLQDNKILIEPIKIKNNNQTISKIYVNKSNYSYDFYYPYIYNDNFNTDNGVTTQKFFISSKNSYTDYIMINTTYWKSRITTYKINPFEKLGFDFWQKDGQRLQIGGDINRGYLMWFEDDSQETYYTNPEFFINNGNYVYTSTGDDFLYLNNGNIENGEINMNDIKNQSINDNEYNSLDDYFNVVTNFIDGLSTDLVKFGEIVQQVYNKCPSFLNGFIVVLYILGNAYIVFKLIKR